ncbi:hypothetical protein GCM10011514_39530 [Emticicia aquatilis]|uniref:TIGR02646 family protein n=1 Tax=Emticicia aquatilis TaxID=1537369 RepID=A0A917DV60_9BACT|nr:hypothetical protein [Emticicia aquatilis]GGD71510.1 hypothetical protein GCM10011514_39530 [Emticicia aquatilis]
MINVTRGQRPTSLDRTEIRGYLEQLADYNLLDEETRKKAAKPDAGAYRNSDVLEAFDRDFYSKCYLTEQKYANSWAMDIEHFKSKAFGQFPELKYDWDNLYPCSHDANLLKPKKDPADGYLDPCDPNDDVEREIVYTLGLGGVAFFDPLDNSNIKAKNTAYLLDKVHNGGDFDSKQKTAEVRLLIAKKAEDVKEAIMAWLDAKGNLQEEIRTSRKIKNLLSRKSDFTMLLRSLDCVRKYVPADFLD